MKTNRLRRFDHMTRYKVAAILFSLVYVLLWLRVLFDWPDVSVEIMRVLWVALTTPAMFLILYNVVDSSWTIFKTRRRINKLLDDRKDTTPDDAVKTARREQL